MRQTACLVVNPITVDSYAFLFNCIVSQIRSIKLYNDILNIHIKYIQNIYYFAMFHGLPITTQDDTKRECDFSYFHCGPWVLIWQKKIEKKKKKKKKKERDFSYFHCGH